jgi:gamma-glutamylcyclotransferase (GGCT)/AIG2-like uncharacterized protein YtfP
MGLRPALFVYGTLRRDAPGSRADLLGRDATFAGYGRACGRLYDLGRYPGAILDESAGTWVYGELYRLERPGLLDRLDAYEGCAPGDAAPMFERVVRAVERIDGTLVDAFVYTYHGPIDGERELRSGDYGRASARNRGDAGAATRTTQRRAAGRHAGPRVPSRG